MLSKTVFLFFCECGQQLSCGYTKIVLLDDPGYSIHEGDPTSGGGSVCKKISDEPNWEPTGKLELKIITRTHAIVRRILSCVLRRS